MAVASDITYIKSELTTVALIDITHTLHSKASEGMLAGCVCKELIKQHCAVINILSLVFPELVRVLHHGNHTAD